MSHMICFCIALEFAWWWSGHLYNILPSNQLLVAYLHLNSANWHFYGEIIAVLIEILLSGVQLIFPRAVVGPSAIDRIETHF